MQEHIDRWAAILTEKANDPEVKFIIDRGRKYTKVICERFGGKSVHAFVDHNTGEVYKAATWRVPAKGVRYNLANEDNRNEMFAKCDIYGSYLYIR